MKNKLHILFLFFIFCMYADRVTAQSSKAIVDSLYRLYIKEVNDTGKIRLLIKLCNASQDGSTIKGLGYAREALELSERIHYDYGICAANLQIGDYYYDQLNYSMAIRHFLKSAEAGERAHLYTSLSRAYNSIGIIYSNQEKNDLSLKYFLKVAKIAEEVKEPTRLAIAYNNIGIAYKDMGRYTQAKEYYAKALEQFEKTQFPRGIASATSNLGIVSHILGDDKAALAYYERSISTFREMKDTASESGILTNIGELYNDKKEYRKALDYYLKGLKMAEDFQRNGFRGDAYEGLAKVYQNLGDYKNALYYTQRHIALKDSVKDEEGMREVQETEKRLENEKQEKAIEILKQKEQIQKLEVRSQSEKLKRSAVIIYSVIGVLLIVLVMAFFIFKAYRQLQRINAELAEKKKEIQDSINYAKNIQEAMLPDVRILQNHFPEGFGLYLPKDVVSGDFYWFSEFNEKIYFAVADCTGHGVPGAFMSMIGIDKLNQSILDKKLESLSGILSFLNVSIKKALKQGSADASLSKDGMDIAICSFNKQTRQLGYAGANRPLWIIRNSEVLEYKATKTSIAGFTDDAQLFEENEIQLEKGDVLYLFSDGFADQFGGPNKKKFMSRQLKQMLLDNHQLPMAEQERKYLQLFTEWRGNLSQVDDVLLLGVRI